MLTTRNANDRNVKETATENGFIEMCPLCRAIKRYDYTSTGRYNFSEE